MKTINYHQPLLLPPNRVWRSYLGGRILDEIQNLPNPDDSHYPEDWVGSATRAINPPRNDAPVDEGISLAKSADGQDVSMLELIENDPTQALGNEHVAAYGAQLQLLVKLLDSSIRLHIQAHPSVPWAQKHLQSNSGKTESWYILATRDENACVYFGFQNPPSPKQWGKMIRDQDINGILACFKPIPVKPGDLLLIPGGLPHAVGAGITMIEAQEPTDYVVRCEYSLPGVKAPPVSELSATMNLGIDGVLDMFDYTTYPVETVKQTFGPRPKVIKQSNTGCETTLLYKPQTDRLEMRTVQATQHDHPFNLSFDGRFSILIVTEGQGTLTAGNHTINLDKWSKVFLPAAIDSAQITGQIKITRCLPPQP